MLTPKLQTQIEQEGNERAEGWQDKMKSQIAKAEYELGADKYASLLQAAEQRAEETTEKIIDLMDFVAEAKGKIADEEIISQVKKSLPGLLEALTPKTTTDATE